MQGLVRLIEAYLSAKKTPYSLLSACLDEGGEADHYGDYNSIGDALEYVKADFCCVCQDCGPEHDGLLNEAFFIVGNGNVTSVKFERTELSPYPVMVVTTRYGQRMEYAFHHLMPQKIAPCPSGVGAAVPP